jgi:hypothetical protein
VIAPAAAATGIAVLSAVALFAAQMTLTTPGLITFTEWRVALLVNGVAMVVVLSARWVAAAPRRDDPRD